MSTKLKEKITVSDPEVGSIYYHYRDVKGEKPYIVRCIALREENEEPTVIYEAQYGDRLTWDRRLSDWHAVIELEGKVISRFRKA
jgi:hypothetical protein